MRIRKVIVQNFRNLGYLEVFPQKNTVIVGENNAGKSNFVHAMRLLFDPQAERLRINLSEEDINERARESAQMYFSITAEIGGLQDHIEVETCFKERISEDGDETFVTIKGTYEPDEDGILAWSSYLLPEQSRSSEPMVLSKRMARAVPLYYLDAVRDAAKDTKATGRGLLAQLLDKIDYTDVEDVVLGHLSRANNALNEGGEISELAKGLTQQLTSHIPGGQSEISIAIAGEDSSRLTDGFRLHLRKTPDSYQSDISRHGTGLQNLALIAMFRHQVNANSSNTPLLAIEEPEAHLHPHAQRTLCRDLSSVDAPVILTTHSPTIVSCVDPLSLVLLRCVESGETKSFQIDPRNFHDRHRKELSKLMRKGMGDVFFSRAIILVEGESELLALPEFARILGCDFDRDSISLVAVNGNDFSSVLKACSLSDFSIPVTVVYDTDVLHQKDNKLLNQALSAGLISKEVCHALKSDQPNLANKRRQVLDSLGWIGVTKNFEEAVCRYGYLETAIQAVRDFDPENDSQTKALAAYLTKHDLEEDYLSISAFIAKRDNLKVPVANAISDAVHQIRVVPPSYKKAIRKASLESVGRIAVDEFFETKVCSAGFFSVIWKYLHSKNAENRLNQYFDKKITVPNASSVCAFVSEEMNGEDDILNLRIAIADEIENCGCKNMADDIRAELL